MNLLKSTYRTLRWRLVPLRYFGKWRRSVFRPSPVAVPRFSAAQALMEMGHAPGPSLSESEVEASRAVYLPRTEGIEQRDTGHPFKNLFTADDLDPANPVFRYALSPKVLDIAHDYFGGRFLFDSILVNYSWPTSGINESQYWHRDYGDTRNLHCVAYLNDVLDEGGGPLTFIDRHQTRKVGSSWLIRRIDDETLAQELGNRDFKRFYGRVGEAVVMDPHACFHFGSRCKVPRLAIFATFCTDRPFVSPIDYLVRYADKAAAAAKLVRPDLNPAYVDRLFGLPR